MRAALLRAYGDVDQFAIDEVKTPMASAGEVLIKIEASAVNPFDLILRQGLMAEMIPLPLPAVLGGDAAGVIAALGEGVTGFSVGDRVVADFPANGRGAHADYGVVPFTSVAKLPDEVSFEQGAAVVKAGLTGRQTVDALGIKGGDRVLVSGALGSVGRAAVQYLRKIGAVPIAGVRPERLTEAREVVGEALDITAPPASAQFDYAISTAAPVAGNLIRNVSNGGHVVSIVPVPDNVNSDDRVTISDLYHHTDAATLNDILKDVATGALEIPIWQTLSLDQISAAQTAVANGASGKVVLKH